MTTTNTRHDDAAYTTTRDMEQFWALKFDGPHAARVPNAPQLAARMRTANRPNAWASRW